MLGPRPYLVLVLLLWVLAGYPAGAQTPAPSPTPAKPPLQIETQTIQVVDLFQRNYFVPREELWVAARLAVNCDSQSPAASKEKALSAEGLTYPANQEDWETANRFPVVNGVATVQLLSFTDASKNPVYYDLVLRTKDGHQLPVRNGLWQAGGANSGPLVTTTRAPNQSWEWSAMIGLLVAGGLTVYWLMGRLLFLRLLRHRRLAVGAALGVSNTLVVMGWACLAASAVGLYLFPVILWHQPYWAYVLAWGGYFAAMLAVYGVAVLVTRE